VIVSKNVVSDYYQYFSDSELLEEEKIFAVNKYIGIINTKKFSKAFALFSELSAATPYFIESFLSLIYLAHICNKNDATLDEIKSLYENYMSYWKNTKIYGFFVKKVAEFLLETQDNDITFITFADDIIPDIKDETIKKKMEEKRDISLIKIVNPEKRSGQIILSLKQLRTFLDTINSLNPKIIISSAVNIIKIYHATKCIGLCIKYFKILKTYKGENQLPDNIRKDIEKVMKKSSNIL